jgi:hypothetical protein
MSFDPSKIEKAGEVPSRSTAVEKWQGLFKAAEDAEPDWVRYPIDGPKDDSSVRNAAARLEKDGAPYEVKSRTIDGQLWIYVRVLP